MGWEMNAVTTTAHPPSSRQLSKLHNHEEDKVVNRSIRKSILVLSAFVSSMLPLLVASSTPARADAPLTFVIPTDFTFVEAPSPDTCSFPLEVHISGTLRITYFTGNTFREIMTAPGFRATYTNLDNGQSLTSVYPASTHVTWEEDGGVVY